MFIHLFVLTDYFIGHDQQTIQTLPVIYLLLYSIYSPTNQRSENSSSVSGYPLQFNFTFTNLSAYTNYSLYIQWTYKSVDYNGTEYTAGVFESLSITELTRQTFIKYSIWKRPRMSNPIMSKGDSFI